MNSADRNQWNDSGSDGPEPDMPLHKEMTEAIKKCRERDVEQGFWEIRSYANRNHAMHSGILDRRICGEYDKVRYYF